MFGPVPEFALIKQEPRDVGFQLFNKDWTGRLLLSETDSAKVTGRNGAIR